MEIKPAVQKYAWGKPAKESAVAKLFQTYEPKMVFDDTPYAELWMGTHPSGPAVIKSTGTNLLEYIHEHRQVLGSKSVEVFGDDLPFLLKVLSINKALSIQAHPAKIKNELYQKHAEQLHRCRPDLYKDPNHKPEIAIALTRFEALCGFRPIDEIRSFLKSVPELRNVISRVIADKLIESTECDAEGCLKECLRSLLTSPDSTVATELRDMLERFKNADEGTREEQLAELIERLHSHFPQDVGCFMPFFLNYIVLKPGEAIFLGPNEPHAYLSGDCVECMACSDNVVRAGLTPKFKDVDTLCDMLIYAGRPAQAKLFQPMILSPHESLYKPPVPDFAVAKITVKPERKLDLTERPVATILLCISGKATLNGGDLSAGRVYFLAANESVCISDVTEEVLVFQAMANV